MGAKRSGAVLRSRWPGMVVLLLMTALPLSACNGELLQRAFSADPNASRWGEAGKPQAQLPADFPLELRYDQATLLTATPANRQVAGTTAAAPAWTQTRWSSPDQSQTVLNFYRQRLQTDGWQVLREVTGDNQTSLTAQKQDLQVVVAIPTPAAPQSQATPSNPLVSPTPGDRPPGQTTFSLDYARGVSATAIAAPELTNNPDFSNPQPGAEFTASTSTTTSQTFTDLDQAPADLQAAIRDLAQLGVLSDTGTNTSSSFNPNQEIQRRTFVRWLVLTNNRIYRDRPARQIRLAPANTPPAFRDVPSTDPDFAYIQGLAEAGFLPSTLSGDSTATLFRPNAPLTRETLLQWKVPVDLRQILPTATVESVKQIWGFKDANRVDVQALQAVLADHQNGDLSNIRRIFGSTLLLQPKKAVTRAQAAATLWYIGAQGDGFSVQDVLQGEQQANRAATVEPSATPAATPQ